MLLRAMALAALSLSVVVPPASYADEAVKIGITMTGIPFTFVDPATSEPAGAMVDLAKAIALINGFQPQFEISPFPALIPALTTGRIKIISASMYITDKRREVINFSAPVYSYGEALFVSSADKSVNTIEDLKGATVGAPVGSTMADDLLARHTFGEVKQYDSISDIIRDVRLGRIKAGFADMPIIAYQISQNGNLGIRMIDDYRPMHVGDIALAVAKGDEQLLKKIDDALRDLKSQGRITQILARYGL
ncbi:amino acid ABC transporter substrate-binding protein, PAAT family [Rhizobiales bacterium GAS188]|nr:amino acid ABC transporter substrate-binding protein, PAAT family [Rhizobiales bacterium GAS188]